MAKADKVHGKGRLTDKEYDLLYNLGRSVLNKGIIYVYGDPYEAVAFALGARYRRKKHLQPKVIIDGEGNKEIFDFYKVDVESGVEFPKDGARLVYFGDIPVEEDFRRAFHRAEKEIIVVVNNFTNNDVGADVKHVVRPVAGFQSKQYKVERIKVLVYTEKDLDKAKEVLGVQDVIEETEDSTRGDDNLESPLGDKEVTTSFTRTDTVRWDI